MGRGGGGEGDAGLGIGPSEGVSRLTLQMTPGIGASRSMASFGDESGDVCGRWVGEMCVGDVCGRCVGDVSVCEGMGANRSMAWMWGLRRN